MDALSNALAGIQNASWRFDAAASSIASAADVEQPPGSDLATDMVSVLTAPIAYAANARVVRAAHDAGQNLLDALG